MATSVHGAKSRPTPEWRGQVSIANLSLTREWRHALTVGAVLVIACALRLPALTAVGFSSDEAVYAGQGAALVGLEPYADLFSLFRAHPLLLQAAVGTTFLVTGVNDFAARLVVAVVFGYGTVIATYLLARTTYGPRVAVLAALIVAVVPYHVVLSRQVMVDTALAFFFTLALTALSLAISTGRGWWLVLAAVLAGLAALAKEIAVLLVPTTFVVLVAARKATLFPVRTWLVSGLAYLVTVAPFILSRQLGPRGNTSDYFLWQLSRPPNHEPDYFLRVAFQFVGPALLALIALGVILALRRRRGADFVLLIPLAVFLIFFQAWPTKLFPYLLPLVPIAGILGAAAAMWLAALTRATPLGRRWPIAAASLAVILGASAFTAWTTISASPARPAGFVEVDVELQDFAGAREAALWASVETPSNSRFMTIGPSFGNVLRFYGNRDSVAMSVSPDPMLRNPAYIPILNPDRALRDSSIDYIIWDAYSADRSAFYHSRLMTYVRKFDGRAVFSAFVDASGGLATLEAAPPGGVEARVVVYSVTGGNRTTSADDVSDQ